MHPFPFFTGQTSYHAGDIINNTGTIIIGGEGTKIFPQGCKLQLSKIRTHLFNVWKLKMHIILKIEHFWKDNEQCGLFDKQWHTIYPLPGYFYLIVV